MKLMAISKKGKNKVICIVLSGFIALSGVFLPGFSNYSVSAASISLGNYSLDSRIHLNTIGYIPSQEKKATIAASCTNFSLVKESGEVVYTGTTTSSYNTDTSEQVSIADFSSVTQEGSYILVVPNVGKSTTFKIQNNVYLEPFKTSMLGIYLMRCGTAVSATYNGKTYSHQACHTQDAYTDYINGQHSIKDSKKGWHDAGDYNKYVVNAGVTVGSMLFAWEQYKDQIEKLSWAIPENTNSLPDYLDEVKYELDWLFTMQYPDGSGKVSHKVSTKDFGGFILPERENTERYFTSWSTAATADFVAMMAMASRAFRPYDSAYADKCLAAAKTSYACLKANPGNVDSVLTDFKTGTYTATDKDDRLWAAAEMWETLGDRSYLSDFEAAVSSFEPKIDVDFDWWNVNNLGMYRYLLSTRSGKNEQTYNSIKSALVTAANSIVTTRNNHGYARPLGTSYYWGCNGGVARQTMLLQIANKLSPNSNYISTSLDALNYLFGRNYYNRSFVTGLGLNPPMNTHDRRSGGDSIAEPWPGCLVGGAWPTAKDWVDIQDNYNTNEIAINWSGALIYALASTLSQNSSPTYIYGDVNGNNVVDAIDYALLKKHLLGYPNALTGPNALKLADLNSDGTVNVFDLAILKKYLLGMIPSLPYAK